MGRRIVIMRSVCSSSSRGGKPWEREEGFREEWPREREGENAAICFRHRQKNEFVAGDEKMRTHRERFREKDTRGRKRGKERSAERKKLATLVLSRQKVRDGASCALSFCPKFLRHKNRKQRYRRIDRREKWETYQSRGAVHRIFLHILQ